MITKLDENTACVMIIILLCDSSKCGMHQPVLYISPRAGVNG